ncbi:FDLD family class I lanthipeptide [Streptomyces sp. NPDC051214]|uniref:FDLD family class I lanthipeptide n=1 Tax=Streptomyces sp. NPDC051214 TaxID=3155282 RepID=UPI003431DE5D
MTTQQLIDIPLDEFDLDIRVDVPEAGTEDTDPMAWWCTHRYSCRWTKCCSGELMQNMPTEYWN